MELYNAQLLARKLMDHHGLESIPFRFDRSNRRLGCCHWRNVNNVSYISLSRSITLLNDEEVIRNTILHEIAHALVGYGNNHNKKWRLKALEIGCNAKRCSSTHSRKEGRWQGVCPSCNRVFHRYRTSSRLMSGRWICPCGGRFYFEDTFRGIARFN